MKLSSSHLRRGTVLIVAMLVAALIAFVLGSYLNLSLSSARFAGRTFYSNAAFNLVETGAEEAVWSFNHAGTNNGWNSWAHNSSDAWEKFEGFNFAPNTSGSVKVYVENYAATGGFSPKVIALASVNPPTEAPVTQMLEVTLARRSHFAGGLVAKNSVTFNGGSATVDSWNSDPDNNPATPPVPYTAAVRNDHARIAATWVLVGNHSSKRADILGYVTTGGTSPDVGLNGTIRGFATPPGVPIDPSRIATDFVFSFDPLAAPTGGTPLASIGPTLGTLGTATSWQCNSLSLNGSQTLTILGQVTLVLTASSGADALDLVGNAQIIIPAGSSLALYVEGNVRIIGNGGIGNGNVQPVTCQFWGTNTSAAGQTIELTGNGSLAGVVYAPNAAVTLDGNSDMMGAVIARDITIAGNANFHYDESLPLYGDASFGVVKWRELTTAAERQSYMSLMNGW
ncbi:MAG TPA: hypothetical protein VFB27_07260 [Opitutaceae bacterium]|nr:hypothetical protein [Opitutaceae bacterium]